MRQPQVKHDQREYPSNLRTDVRGLYRLKGRAREKKKKRRINRKSRRKKRKKNKIIKPSL